MENVTINTISDSDDLTTSASSYANGSLVRGTKVIPGSTTCDTPDDTVFTATGDIPIGTTITGTTTPAPIAGSTATSTTPSSGGGGSSY